MKTTLGNSSQKKKKNHQTGLAFLLKRDQHIPGEPCKFPWLSNSPECPAGSSPCPPDSWLSLSWCKPPQLSLPSPLQLLPNEWSTLHPKVCPRWSPLMLTVLLSHRDCGCKVAGPQSQGGNNHSGDKSWKGHF